MILSALVALQVSSIQRTKHDPYMLASAHIGYSIAITLNEEGSIGMTERTSTTNLCCTSASVSRQDPASSCDPFDPCSTKQQHIGLAKTGSCTQYLTQYHIQRNEKRVMALNRVFISEYAQRWSSTTDEAVFLVLPFEQQRQKSQNPTSGGFHIFNCLNFDSAHNLPASKTENPPTVLQMTKKGLMKGMKRMNKIVRT